jgi:hypothetical protein
MSIWTIDYDRLATLLLPVRLRQPIQVAWAKLLASEVKNMHGLFLANRTQNLIELGYNGQTILIEKCLNDKLDDTLRRIEVMNIPFNKTPVYIRKRGEAAGAVYIRKRSEAIPFYIPLRSEYFNPITLEVRVPTALMSQQSTIIAILRTLLVATVNYRITYF